MADWLNRLQVTQVVEYYTDRKNDSHGHEKRYKISYLVKKKKQDADMCVLL